MPKEDHHDDDRNGQMRIDFLFLDLDTCTRCRATDTNLIEALEVAGPALAAAGIEVSITKTLIGDEQQAREHGFVSSPIILIDGIDIAGKPGRKCVRGQLLRK